MARFLADLLALLVLVALARAASGQTALAGNARVQPVVGPIRDGGIFHLASGTWTRKGSAAAIGQDVLYDNTCASSNYLALSGDVFIDEGRLPSRASPDGPDSKPGCALSYAIDGFQIGYCTVSAPGTRYYQVTYRNSAGFCTPATFNTTNAWAVHWGV